MLEVLADKLYLSYNLRNSPSRQLVFPGGGQLVLFFVVLINKYLAMSGRGETVVLYLKSIVCPRKVLFNLVHILSEM